MEAANLKQMSTADLLLNLNSILKEFQNRQIGMANLNNAIVPVFDDPASSKIYTVSISTLLSLSATEHTEEQWKEFTSTRNNFKTSKSIADAKENLQKTTHYRGSHT